MKKVNKVYLLFAAAIFAMSCSKTPNACMTAPTDAFVVKPVSFVNCSDDYDFNFWSFGDGAGGEEENISHLYTTPGTYQVKLTAYSKDGRKEDDVTSTVKVGYKVIDRIEMTNWSYPGAAQEIHLEIDDIKSNESYSWVTNTSMPLNFTFQGNYKLVKELYKVEMPDGSGSISGAFSKIDADFHRDLSNPYLLSESPELYVYWHFEYE